LSRKASKNRGELLAQAPSIQKVDVLADVLRF
jgi:hypothetical protein